MNVNIGTWFVYMLRCSDGSLYTGVTTDIERRFLEHKEGKNGAKYTRSRFPISVVYRETCASRSEAQIRESAIKKYTKNEKELLIKQSKKENLINKSTS